jgi:hypothetical protein
LPVVALRVALDRYPVEFCQNNDTPSSATPDATASAATTEGVGVDTV